MCGGRGEAAAGSATNPTNPPTHYHHHNLLSSVTFHREKQNPQPQPQPYQEHGQRLAHGEAAAAKAAALPQQPPSTPPTFLFFRPLEHQPRTRTRSPICYMSGGCKQREAWGWCRMGGGRREAAAGSASAPAPAYTYTTTHHCLLSSVTFHRKKQNPQPQPQPHQEHACPICCTKAECAPVDECVHQCRPQQQATNVPAVPSARCFTLRRRRRDVARLHVLQYFTKAKQHDGANR